MTKRINFKNTVTLVAKLAADSAGLNEKRALNNLHVEIKPLLRRRICLYGKAVVEASAIAEAARLNLRNYGSQYIDQIIACANAEAEALDMDSSHIIVKHTADKVIGSDAKPVEKPAAPAKTAEVIQLPVRKAPVKPVKHTPVKTKPVTPIQPVKMHLELLSKEEAMYQPRKVANEISTLAHGLYANRALLIRAFSDAVRRDKPVLGSSMALASTNKWLALADTTIKNDVPLLTAVKEKIVEVHLAYIRLIKKGY